MPERKVDESLVQRIIDFLRGNPEGADRRTLVEKIHGRPAMTNLSNDLADRDNRAAIQAARRRGVHIVSSSSGKGYRLSNDRAEVEKTIVELESRRERIAEEIRGMRRTYGMEPVKKVHLVENATQLDLLND